MAIQYMLVDAINKWKDKDQEPTKLHHTQYWCPHQYILVAPLISKVDLMADTMEVMTLFVMSPNISKIMIGKFFHTETSQ